MDDGPSNLSRFFQGEELSPNAVDEGRQEVVVASLDALGDLPSPNQLGQLGHLSQNQAALFAGPEEGMVQPRGDPPPSDLDTPVLSFVVTGPPFLQLSPTTTRSE